MQTSQSSEWRLKTEERMVMLIVSFDFRGVVHFKFLLERHTVNKEYYLGVCARRSAEHDQVCGRTVHEFCTKIMYYRTNLSLCKSFTPKTKNVCRIKPRAGIVGLHSRGPTLKMTMVKKIRYVLCPANNTASC